MKTIIKTCFYFLLLVSTASANAAGRAHEGFYCQLGIGPSFGHIHDKYTDAGYTEEITWGGSGLAFDFRIGGAFQKDWILTFDGTNQSVSAPSVKSGSLNGTFRSQESISEISYGLGLTRYIMPSNVYAGISLGTGTYVLEYLEDLNNSNSLTKIRSKFGFSSQLRAGKTFFLGKHWGLGVGAGYTFLKCKTTIEGSTEKMWSQKLLVTVNVTYE